MRAQRLPENPIIRPHMDDRMGDNINGPSLIHVPDWVDDPLGEYYLYFAHHRGTYIRLAYADELTGSWKIHTPGALSLSESNFHTQLDTEIPPHIASPDVHVNDRENKFYMYYHGVTPTGQKTRVATSDDGIDFSARDEIIDEWYFRRFQYDGSYYAIVRGQNHLGGGRITKSRDPLAPFQPGPDILDRMRHCAVHRSGDKLYVFYSNIGDCPESIDVSIIDLSQPWTEWSPTDGQTILTPQQQYEGVDCALNPSEPGPVTERVRELRDPAVYAENGRTYLVYTTAGESGLALARLADL